MELFRTAQRIPPRRIPVVLKYDALPATSPSIPIQLPAKRAGVAYLAGGAVAVVALVFVLSQWGETESAVTPHPHGSGSASAPAPVASFRVIRPGDASGGGGGGGIGGPAAGPLVQEKANASVVTQLRKIIFTLKKDPSTKANMTDRLALFQKYFNSLTPSDRIALFGTIDFRQLEHAIRQQGDKGPGGLDRCLAQLQLILF